MGADVKLSVIIVNYNVEYFLEQCLHSVMKASRNLSVETFVVDNNSVDGSVSMVREKFPSVKLIENKKNTGFSYANNQAIKESAGQYVLLLNPDTLVEEDTFTKVCAFMDSHRNAGGLGVKMIDGKGNFLPESKRGLPTPSVAFFKIFGLSSLFPKSRVFGKYHLGYLDKDKIHEVEILSGAFMLLRKEALEKTGLLDETFFMYGEDIDLSYRIIKAGYKNYYFPETCIIHYKGESTKKSSVNYVFVFYNAMVIFARKHFSPDNARLFSFFINLAIYLRAFIAIANRFLKRIFPLLIDAVIIFVGIFFLKEYWEYSIKHTNEGYYPDEFLSVAVPACIVIWLTSIYYSGGYDKPTTISKVSKGILYGSAIILIIYALLPESVRFSRALILFGSMWTYLSLLGIRLLLHLTGSKTFRINTGYRKRFLLVGTESETQRVSQLLNKTSIAPGFIGYVINDDSETLPNGYIGRLSQLGEMAQIYKIDEVIFCAKDIPARQIIDQMSVFGNRSLDFKIAPPESLYIIGSNSINSSGELYTIDLNTITKESNLRSKRLFDVTVSLLLICVSPLLMLLTQSIFSLIKNLFLVFIGRYSFVGFDSIALKSDKMKLPKIKKGVIYPSDILKEGQKEEETIHRLNFLYTKDYRVSSDFRLVIGNLNKLGRHVD